MLQRPSLACLLTACAAACLAGQEPRIPESKAPEYQNCPRCEGKKTLDCPSCKGLKKIPGASSRKNSHAGLSDGGIIAKLGKFCSSSLMHKEVIIVELDSIYIPAFCICLHRIGNLFR